MNCCNECKRWRGYRENGKDIDVAYCEDVSCKCHSTPATSWEEKFFEVCVGDLRTSKETRLLVLDFIRKELEATRQDLLETIEKGLPQPITKCDRGDEITGNCDECLGKNSYRKQVLTLLDSLKKKT